MGNLEQALLEDLPFEYNEEGECIYCQNMQIVENQNLILMQQVEFMFKEIDNKDLLIFELRELLEDLMDEN